MEEGQRIVGEKITMAYAKGLWRKNLLVFKNKTKKTEGHLAGARRVRVKSSENSGKTLGMRLL